MENAFVSVQKLSTADGIRQIMLIKIDVQIVNFFLLFVLQYVIIFAVKRE